MGQGNARTENVKSRAAVVEELRRAGRVLAVTHINPDGDAMGSMAALGHIVQALGHEARLYCETPPPPHLAWLALPAPVVRSLAELGAWTPDLIVALDCADDKRAGREMQLHFRRCAAGGSCCTACVDHHVGTPHFARINWADPAYAATGAMVADLARDLGVPLTGGLAEALYLALVADTGTFSFTNTNAHALRLAADILEGGLPLADFMAVYENNWTLNRMRLWGRLMTEAKLECDGAVAVSVVPQEYFDQFGSPKSDLEFFASWLRRLRGVRVVLYVRASLMGSKVSLRSMGDVNVRKIAVRFGGGGHDTAAGVDLACPPHEAAGRLLAAIREALDCEKTYHTPRS